jgi:hypothetical protein
MIMIIMVLSNTAMVMILMITMINVMRMMVFIMSTMMLKLMSVVMWRMKITTVKYALLESRILDIVTDGRRHCYTSRALARSAGRILYILLHLGISKPLVRFLELAAVCAKPSHVQA